ncbi:MAG: Peptidase Imelysin [Crocinitomicaceae bacterium]|jgi:hypothetical protein|nr:Peptidase Imelysin [Crocinitomicaceae bacterium]
MKIYIAFLTVILVLSGACKKKETHWTLEVSKVRRSYLHTQQQLLNNLVESNDSLYDQVVLFKNTVVTPTFYQAKTRWGNAYKQFLLLGPYRYGSIASGAFAAENNYLDLFPLNPAYIDYTVADPYSGIINDVSTYPSIITDNIRSWNQQGSPQNISNGFHVLEFFLWGETGNRPMNDFNFLGNEVTQRRRDFLWFSALNLQTSIAKLANTQEYENSLLLLSTNDFMQRMIDGLREFITEDFCNKTIKASLDTQDPRLEISHFSNRSMEAIYAKLLALKYAFNAGTLLDTDDTEHYFLENLLDTVDPGRMEKIRSSLSKIESSLDGITVDYQTAITTAAHRSSLQEVVTELESISAELLAFKDNFK